jgi:hypothetical protein
VDEFDNGRNTDWWSAYTGEPNGLEGTARWNPANLVDNPDDGTLDLKTTIASDGMVESAGSSNARACNLLPDLLARPVGAGAKWGFRFRADPDNGSVGMVFLLYKLGGGWPPEIDIVEDGGGDRQSAYATVHWKDANGTHQQRRIGQFTHDFTQWTTVYVTVEPNLIYISIDGARVASWNGVLNDGTDVSALAIPLDPMWFGAQTHRKLGTPVPTSLSTTRVDWVAKYHKR